MAEQIPMAMVIEGKFNDRADFGSFPGLLEDMKQVIAARTDLDASECHIFIRGSAEKVSECVEQIHKESQ